MKTAKPLLLLAIMAIGLVGGIFLFAPVVAVHAAPTPNGSAHPDGIVSTPLPTTGYVDSVDYDTTCPGGLSGCTAPAGYGQSWSATIFSVTYTGTVSVTITDCCYEGDYYSLWMTTDPTGLTGWTLVGTTDQVYTGPELVAPTYDPYWTGTGVSYSSTTFNIPISGTVLFADTDDLLIQMVNLLGPSCGGSAVVYSGCSATGISAAGSWSPAGYYISFAAASTAGCLSSGSTSWPSVTFTDGSSAAISVTGGAPPSACAAMTIEDLFGSNPITTTPSVSSPNYYDLSITGLTAGTADVCFTTSLASASTTMLYWDGSAWVSASGISFSSGTICGSIPVTALDTPSTPIVIGTPSVPPPVPEFGAPAIMVAAVGMFGLAIASRRLRPALRK